ncbi:MAG: hypothetical protein CBD18_07905 [Opitutales bacterium TMED158]|nr:MAG: hypothetical protein CBD18_07905 [Opitutales bacterium TMED158]
MKKFVFNLESVLGLREWEEQLSQQAFAAASSEVAILEQRILETERERDAVFEKWSAASGSRFTRNDRLAMIGSAEALQQSRKASEDSLKTAREKRTKAMSGLSDAIRAKKVVENLKQRRLEDYRTEAQRVEAQEVEDVFNSRRRKGM